MIVVTRVGMAIQRPPTPRNTRFRHIAILADSESDGEIAAAQWAASIPGVEMPVSTEITDVVF